MGDRCSYCDGTGWRTLTVTDLEQQRGRSRGELVAWTMHGDWPALLAALEKLRAQNRPAYHGFLDEATTGTIRTPLGRAGLKLVAGWMPSRVRVPAGIITAWEQRDRRADEAERARQRRLGTVARRDRDRAMRDARRAGLTTGQIAAAFGVSERAARRIA